MGAGALPTAIHNGKLYFLFGKESDHDKPSAGYSDFGGTAENNETLFKTMLREFNEESTGFFGTDKDVKKLMTEHGTYNIDLSPTFNNKYRTHIFPYKFDEQLPHYYNNNHRFIMKKLSPSVIKTVTIFEKEDLKWVCIDDLKKMRPQFRNFYRNIVDDIIDQRRAIKSFIQKARHHNTRSKTIKNKKNNTKKHSNKRHKRTRRN